MTSAILRMVKNLCRSHNVRFKLVRSPQTYLGYYCSATKTLSLAMSRKDQINGRVHKNSQWRLELTALHELCHMLQHKRKDKNWEALDLDGDSVGWSILDYEAGQIWVPKKDIIKSAKHLMALEWDAEKRAIEMADMFGVAYSRSNYIREAKAYVYSYYVTAETGFIVSSHIRDKWKMVLNGNLEYDLDRETLRKLIKIAKENKHLLLGYWQGKSFLVNGALK